MHIPSASKYGGLRAEAQLRFGIYGRTKDVMVASEREQAAA